MALQQTGQLDWVSLADKTVSTSIGLLNRLAQAGIDQFTIELTKAFGQTISISEQNLDRVEKSLLNSRKFGLSAKALFVGTGISAIPALMAKTRGGVAFATITMSLRSSFEASYTARVLSQLLRTWCPPEVSIPSINQLESLSNELSACGTDVEFGNTVYGLQKLLIQPDKLQSFERRTVCTPPHPVEMAAVLQELCSMCTLSRENTYHYIFDDGSGDASWIAAFASRIIGISVTFEVNGMIVFERSSFSQREGHLRISTLRASSSEQQQSSSKEIQKLKAANIHVRRLARKDPDEEVGPTCRVRPDAVMKDLLGVVPEHKRDSAVECFLYAAFYLRSQPVSVAACFMGYCPTAEVFLNDLKESMKMLGVNEDTFARCEREWKARPPTIPLPNARRLTSVEECGEFEANKCGDLCNQKLQQEFKSPEERTEATQVLQDLLALWTVVSRLTLLSGTDLTLDGQAALRLTMHSNLYGAPASFNSARSPRKTPFDQLWAVNNTGRLELKPASILILLWFIGSKELHDRKPTYVHLGASSEGLNYVAVSSGGYFAVLNTALSLDSSPLEAHRVIVGYGGVYVAGRAYPALRELQKKYKWFDKESVAYPPKRLQISELRTLQSADLTKIRIDHDIFVDERSDECQIAWSLTCRDVSRIVFDVLVTPLDITNLMGTNYLFSCENAIYCPDGSEKNFRDSMKYYLAKFSPLATTKRTKDDLVDILAVEEIATSTKTEPVKGLQVIPAHNNSIARILAVYALQQGSTGNFGSFGSAGADGRALRLSVFVCKPEGLESLATWAPEGSVIVVE